VVVATISCDANRMTRTEAIAAITQALPSLDDEQAAKLAEVAQAMFPARLPLALTAEERAGIERAREDFKHGRTHSSSEARALSAAMAAKRRDTLVSAPSTEI